MQSLGHKKPSRLRRFLLANRVAPWHPCPPRHFKHRVRRSSRTVIEEALEALWDWVA